MAGWQSRGHGDSETSAHQAAFAGVLHRLQVAGEASLALPSSLLPAETPQPQQGALLSALTSTLFPFLTWQ